MWIAYWGLHKTDVHRVLGVRTAQNTCGSRTGACASPPVSVRSPGVGGLGMWVCWRAVLGRRMIVCCPSEKNSDGVRIDPPFEKFVCVWALQIYDAGKHNITHKQTSTDLQDEKRVSDWYHHSSPSPDPETFKKVRSQSIFSSQNTSLVATMTHDPK